MPAWQGELTENEIWQLVSFIRRIPTLTPEDLRVVTSGSATLPEEPPLKWRPRNVPRGWTPDAGRLSSNRVAASSGQARRLPY
jgi:hypothetical protein